MSRSPIFKKVVQLIHQAQLSQSQREEMNDALTVHSKARSHGMLSRRDFLSITGKTVAALPLSGLVAHHAMAELIRRPVPGEESVVILGAGTAGLVTAYRLQNAGISCSLYEASHRIGGRMFTHEKFNSEGMFCELGGELVDSDHSDLINLCRELDIGIQDLSGGDQNLETTLFSIQKTQITSKEMLNHFRPFAHQIAADLNEIFSDGNVYMPTYKDRHNPKIVQYDQMSLAEYLYSKKDIEKWVLDLIGVLYLGEFGLELEYQSALNFLTLISTDLTELKLLGDSDESKRIVGGSSTLPNTLGNVIKEKVPIHLDHQLVRIQDTGTKFKLTFLKGNTPVEASAKQVVCTLPFSVLRKIEGISYLNIDPRLKEGINSLGYGANSKLMMGFKNKIWREKFEKIPSNGTVLSYEQQEFWETSRMQVGQSGILTNFLGGKIAKKLPSTLLKDNLTELEGTFTGISSQFDTHTALMHWSGYPWSKGSFICPMPGQYTHFHGLAAAPHLSGRFLFAGEHTSVENCGFMNGAVESGNRTAKWIIANR